MIARLITLLVLLVCTGTLMAEAKRIVSIGPNITETLFALGVEGEVIGRDGSSTYPEATKSLKIIGTGHKFSPEGIVALNPSHVFINVTRSPMTRLVDALKGAGIKVEAVKTKPNLEGAFADIRQIAKAVSKVEEGEALIAKMKTKQAELDSYLAKHAKKQSALFVYARGMKTLFVAGKNTSSEGLFDLAGLKNGASSFENFRPLTAEAVVSSAPEYIILLESGLKSLGGVNNLKKVPGVALTPAAKSEQIITIKQEALLLLHA